jgi:hypothetical protein
MFRFLLAAILVLAPSPGHAQDSAAQVPVELEQLPFDKKLKLAKAGDDVARIAVAEAYEQGRGTRPDLAEAARWYREAALANNLEAQFRLAKLVAVGADGLRQDLPTATKLLELAAGKGHAGAQYEYARSVEAGRGLARDHATALAWFQKSAEQGYGPAENALGMIYLFPESGKPNAAKAVEYLVKGAEHGDAWAMNNLGALYEQGWGTPIDLIKAKAFYAQAATKGNSAALTNLKRLETLGQ